MRAASSLRRTHCAGGADSLRTYAGAGGAEAQGLRKLTDNDLVILVLTYCLSVSSVTSRGALSLFR